jgi:hypothetical protein
VKAVCGKTACTVWAADGGERASAPPPTRQLAQADEGPNEKECICDGDVLEMASDVRIRGAVRRGEVKPSLNRTAMKTDARALDQEARG